MPRLIANKQLPLERFWLPFQSSNTGNSSHSICLHDGILPDPEDRFAKALNPTLTTLTSIETKKCFALLGQPGLGKLIAVEQWVGDFRARVGEDKEVIFLRSRELASADEVRKLTVDSPRWRRARNQPNPSPRTIRGLAERPGPRLQLTLPQASSTQRFRRMGRVRFGATLAPMPALLVTEEREAFSDDAA